MAKGEIARNDNFSFSHSVFYPFRELSAIFIKFENVVCNLFQFGTVQNLSFGKGLVGLTIHFKLFAFVSISIYLVLNDGVRII